MSIAENQTIAERVKLVTRRFRLGSEGPAILTALLECESAADPGSSPRIEDVAERAGFSPNAVRKFFQDCHCGGVLRFYDEGGEYHLRFEDHPPNPYRISKEAWRKLREKVFERDGHVCKYCGCADGDFHIDHIIPRSRGGGDDIENLAVACPRCNVSKNAKTPEEWKP